ncbi:hypothetical protein IV203_013890 [Nitzschia inconspicua]|uniref:Uncharacterized protein n=1 Tax=Nitzschia inconspicua TaxID=303405 RepID=A0A9K3M6R3_9STRA|nr:hypothetical protein IV203_013890 [Nitzschia inconspicua]
MERFVVNHAGKLALGIMASGVLLYNVTEYLSPSVVDTSSSRRRDVSHAYGSQGHDTKPPPMSIEQARLRAMIENAQQSSWQQNLDNALVAQEKFLLGNERGEKSPEFMKKIEARSKELMEQAEQQQRLEIEREKKRKLTTKIW